MQETLQPFSLLMFVLLHLAIDCAPTQYEGGVRETPDGQLLIDLGDEFNVTLWSVIGNAIKNEVKQQIGQCYAWSKWSYCDLTSDPNIKTGAKTRSRTCGIKIIEESEFCESSCPETYTFTKHGFCVKMYPTKKHRDEAENVCRADGGHLVNIDSMSKVDDVNKTLVLQAFSGNRFYVDGRRSFQAGPFSYGYPMVGPSFIFWGGNDPDNLPDDFCLAYQKDVSRNNAWRLYDYPCDLLLYFMCEIRM